MKFTSLGLAVLVACVVPGLAAGQGQHSSIGSSGAMLSADGTHVTFSRSSYIRAQLAKARPQALTRIFDNLAEKYPQGRYWPFGTSGVAGPDNLTFGHRVWIGAPFAPASDSNVVRIEVAVKLISGSNRLVLSLRDDKAGVPGAVLHSWVLKNLLPPVTCCEVKVGTSAGIPVQAGHQYWVVLSTDDQSKDTFAGWSNSVTEPLTPIQIAHNEGSGWSASGTAPAPAFAVFASP